ncbi:MAG: GTP-binding protein [Thermoprotei archaeon]|nr:MAG: GTP-binding protein [Thermoprotei archaeon]RLF25511.1 MAG: GTP-binding protein [Thermoprotei archaeon]
MKAKPPEYIEAWRKVRRIIEKADLVIEVLDARDPQGTRCPRVERLAINMGKRILLVINKADLVPKEVLEEWKRVLNREFPTIFISARDRLGTRYLWRAIKAYAPKIPVKVAIVGYPNVGKSTIINVLKGRHSVGTSPIPGFTKHTQLVRASSFITVIDTPGIVPLDEDEETLAIKGALRPEALEDPLGPALRLLELALTKDPDVVERVYGIEEHIPLKILEKLARRRGLLLKGGKPNVDEAARIILRDWQNGRLVFYMEPKDYGLA